MSRSSILRLSGLAVIVGIGLSIAVYAVISNIVSDPFGYSWTLDEINKLFAEQIPQDATDIHYSGNRDLGAFLNLEFNAPPSSADKFANTICNGGLYEGYDPFKSVNLGEPFTYTHPMQVSLWSYYSYSPNTPKTVYGNRCGSEYQIRVDKANPSSYGVKTQVYFTCSTVCYSIPIKAIRPADNFPIEILGLEHIGNQYQTTSSELCAGVRSDLSDWTEFTRTNLAGAQLQIIVDGKPTASSDVDNTSNLVHRYDSQGNFVLVSDSGNQRYYCFKTNIEKGFHTLELRLKTFDVSGLSYTWNFSSGLPQLLLK